MKIGIPKGLLYCKYHVLAEEFFQELGCEIITSEDTNKNILNLGVKYAVDDACLPIKIFHGHVASIKDKCDLIFVPRIMRLEDREYICPKFCGLPEMIINSIPNMPPITMEPIYANDSKVFHKYIYKVGKMVTNNKKKIREAYLKALDKQRKYESGINDEDYEMKIALIGHPYNVQDNFVNMNIKKKLNKSGVGVITEEFVNKSEIDKKVKELYKKPFWTFARNSYGSSVYLSQNKKVDGIIYISSFACGIDSVVIELIKEKVRDFPFLVLKVDEQTGQGGFDTRVEAFVDMIERRKKFEDNISPSRERIHCS
ncbi:acyl-CoA dehydratase activase-related protein [Haloimpatiens sp. FM7330]|uniref:acyl-CoA dehydratase activase-related protein n=1 Tax=Haloimpatiens sp. FM7330 TaxID=3298610 RepID=UPI0036424376